jgi:NADH-quinone oxidoreductase subunit J
MASESLYLMSVLGAAGIYLVLGKSSRPLKWTGIVLLLAAAAWLAKDGITRLAPTTAIEGERPGPFFYIFAAIAIASAIRMITHTRPVYCALYFVMVVLSSAGMFLLLAAEFMAFALVIVYAGAILITYLFVLMLAQQSPTPDEPDSGSADYDRIPREPLAATVVGFLLLAVLTDIIAGATGAAARPAPDPRIADPIERLQVQAVQEQWDAAQRERVAEATEQVWRDLERLPERFRETVLAVEPDFKWPPIVDGNGHMIRMIDGEAHVLGPVEGEASDQLVLLPYEMGPYNVERIGVHLVGTYPVSLELAGVILLMAMFGAVVLARRQIELGEEETREAAGMRSLDVEHGDDTAAVDGGGA